MSEKSWPRVYVAAPYADRSFVRQVHKRLAEACLLPTSDWANSDAEEDFTADGACRLAAERNDACLFKSNAVLVLARPGAGGEMFAEARVAHLHGIPLYWVGRRILTAFRSGVKRFGECMMKPWDRRDAPWFSESIRNAEINKAIAAIKEDLG